MGSPPWAPAPLLTPPASILSQLYQTLPIPSIASSSTSQPHAQGREVWPNRTFQDDVLLRSGLGLSAPGSIAHSIPPSSNTQSMSTSAAQKANNPPGGMQNENSKTHRETRNGSEGKIFSRSATRTTTSEQVCPALQSEVSKKLKIGSAEKGGNMHTPLHSCSHVA